MNSDSTPTYSSESVDDCDSSDGFDSVDDSASSDGFDCYDGSDDSDSFDGSDDSDDRDGVGDSDSVDDSDGVDGANSCDDCDNCDDCDDCDSTGAPDSTDRSERLATSSGVDMVYLSDVTAIRKVLASYCQSVDDGHFDEMVNLFTQDCEFAAMGLKTNGRRELRTLMEKSQPPERRGKHMISEPLIDVDGDIASAATDFVFFARTNRVLQSGRYYDKLLRRRGRWLISEREIVFTGDKPTGN